MYWYGVHLSVPMIDSSSNVQLVRCSLGAGGRYWSIPVAGTRAQQQAASKLRSEDDQRKLVNVFVTITHRS